MEFDSSSSEQQLTDLTDFESLPMSNAFHELMRQHMVSAMTDFEQTAPFATNILETPQPFSYLSSQINVIDGMKFEIHKTNGLMGHGNFTFNGVAVSVDFDDSSAAFSFPDATTDLPEQTVPILQLQRFLVDGLLFSNAIGDDEVAGLFPGPTDVYAFFVSVFEQYGQFFGKTTKKTTAHFSNIPQNAIIAVLVDTEEPNDNTIVSALDLSYLPDPRDSSNAQEIDTRQRAALGPDHSLRVTDQYAVFSTDAVPPEEFIFEKTFGVTKPLDAIPIFPEGNFTQWVELCSTFMKIISPELVQYRQLDDGAPYSVADFGDPTTRKVIDDYGDNPDENR